MLRQAKRLPQGALIAVTLHRTAQFFTYGQTQSGQPEPVKLGIDHQSLIRNAQPPGKDPLEIAAFFKPTLRA